MDILTPENIYDTLTGSLWEEYCVPGVENAFADGSLCARLYEQVYQANLRLCDRLGQMDEDPDVELIISNLLQIARHLSLQMYRYGQNTTAR